MFKGYFKGGRVSISNIINNYMGNTFNLFRGIKIVYKEQDACSMENPLASVGKIVGSGKSVCRRTFPLYVVIYPYKYMPICFPCQS